MSDYAPAPPSLILAHNEILRLLTNSYILAYKAVLQTQAQPSGSIVFAVESDDTRNISLADTIVKLTRETITLL